MLSALRQQAVFAATFAHNMNEMIQILESEVPFGNHTEPGDRHNRFSHGAEMQNTTREDTFLLVDYYLSNSGKSRHHERILLVITPCKYREDHFVIQFGDQSQECDGDTLRETIRFALKFHNSPLLKAA